MIKRTIKTPASGTPVIGIEELDMPTKYDGDSCVLSYLSMLVKVFKPLLYKIDSTTSLVASAFVFFVLSISAHPVTKPKYVLLALLMIMFEANSN